MSEQIPLVVTLDEAARLLGVAGVVADPARWVRRAVHRGELAGLHHARRLMVTRASIDRYITSKAADLRRDVHALP